MTPRQRKLLKLDLQRAFPGCKILVRLHKGRTCVGAERNGVLLSGEEAAAVRRKAAELAQDILKLYDLPASVGQAHHTN